jgi:signal peptidase I
MKQTQRWSSILFNLILFMGLVIVWIAFAPAKIGGQASYVMVNGISMEPNYHTGDLVIVRKAETYQVGDVITYRDAEMGAYVIHRIIGIEQGQFIIKGDNNSWIDAYQPTVDEIVGKQWVYAPKAGIAMQWLRKPINLSLTIVLLGGVFMSSMISSLQKAKKEKIVHRSISAECSKACYTCWDFQFSDFLAWPFFHSHAPPLVPQTPFHINRMEFIPTPQPARPESTTQKWYAAGSPSSPGWHVS